MPAGVPVQVRLAEDEVCLLDFYRREKLNPPTRSRALRELAREALRDAARRAGAKLADAQSATIKEGAQAKPDAVAPAMIATT
jgi:hypothetical protein